jgi:hypothetical protein
MTILFSSLAPVKSTSHRFGRGILPTYPTYRADHAAADAAWLVEDNARRDAANRRYDAMAAESAALSRLEAGLCC